MQVVQLKLINDNGTPVAYPGNLVDVVVAQVSDVTKVWIGVSANGLTNQSYPITTPIATILLTYPRVYEGISATVNGSANLYNNSEGDYNIRAGACCINGGQDSISDSDSGSGGCVITINWQHTGNDDGNVTITVNGVDEVVSDVSGESGSFTCSEGDVINSVAQVSSITSLDVDNDIDGDMNGTDNPFEFTAECGKVYTIIGSTNAGE